MIKNTLKIVLFVLTYCLTVSACTKNNVPLEEWEENEFFGLDIDKSDQVSAFHELLSSGKLDWHGTKLEEWNDGWGTDYDLSEGNVSTTCIFDGNVQDARLLFNQLDSIFFNRYNNREPLKLKEWVELEDENYSISYLNFYSYKGYRIGVTLMIVSSEKDENKASVGCVRIGLAASSLSNDTY